MSFPAYQNYQESGKRWLGKLPDSWRVVPFWTLFRRVKRTGFPAQELLSVYRDYGVIRKRDRDDNFNKPSEDLSAYQLVEAGDLAINKMKAWQGSLGVSPHTGIVSPAYFVYRAQHEQVPAYLHYLLRSDPYAVGLMTISKGIRINQWDVDPDHLAQLPVPLPPLPEQTAIAAFLDRETAKIDALVEEQRRLIELLKEKRQAVISHAVTKGLDPTVPMKDSGVEWLGQIPAHWKACKLGHAAKLQSGYAFSSSDFGDVGIPLVRMTNLDRGRLDLSTAVCIPADKSNERVALNAGDIVWGMSGSIGETGSLGNFARVTHHELPSQLNQRVGRFVIYKGLQSDFLELLIQSESFQKQTILFVTGTAQFNVSPEQVQSIIVALPPVDEQAHIVDTVRGALGGFQRLLEEAEKSISLLHERRAALISAAVTGNIDVRAVAVQQAEAA